MPCLRIKLQVQTDYAPNYSKKNTQMGKIIFNIMNAMLNTTEETPECLTSLIIVLLYK